MRKYAVLVLVAISVLGVSSFAGTHPSGCPLANLRKGHQRRDADGSAFKPGMSAKKVVRADTSQKVYIGN